MKAQSFQVRTIKNQIAACLRLIALRVKSAILKLVDLEQKLEVAMNQQLSPVVPVLYCKDRWLSVFPFDGARVATAYDVAWNHGWIDHEGTKISKVDDYDCLEDEGEGFLAKLKIKKVRMIHAGEEIAVGIDEFGQPDLSGL